MHMLITLFNSGGILSLSSCQLFSRYQTLKNLCINRFHAGRLTHCSITILICHYDVMIWHRFLALLALCEGNPVTCSSSQRAGDAELWYFIWCQLHQIIEQTVERQVNGNVMTLLWRHFDTSIFCTPLDKTRCQVADRWQFEINTGINI